MKRRICLIVALTVIFSLAMTLGISAETAEETVSEYGGAFSGERLALAGQVTLVGLLIIFFVLAVLWGILALFKIFTYDIPQRKKQKAELTSKVSDTVQQTADEVAEVSVHEDNDGEIVAAVTAAVQAYLLAESGGTYSGGFVVVSFKKRNEAWKSQN